MKGLTKLVYPFFKMRQKEIARYGNEADTIQQNQLDTLLDTASDTYWGNMYHFSSISNYRTFAERIPLQTYESIKPYISRMIAGERNVLWPSSVKWFAKSSGTTDDKSKFIPVTSHILNNSHYKGGFDSVALYLKSKPDSNFFSHKSFILGGSHAPSAINSQVNCGDLSAVLLQNINPLTNLVRTPDKRIILMDEWESKIKAIVGNIKHKDVGNISGIPSWMLVLIKEVLRVTGKDILTDVWPNLEVFFHGGVSFEPYKTQYDAIIPPGKINYMETYNASEGFFGIQDDLNDRSMLLMIDYQTFFEFIPMRDFNTSDPTTIPLSDVKIGENYAIVISTSGGLWRYIIGDTIKFTSLFPHKFIITGRTKSYINAFGEELMVDNAEKAIATASKLTNSVVKEYTAAPQFLTDSGTGRHQWVIEFEKAPDSIKTFADALDDTLQDLNSDYEAKRYKSITLLPLQVISARKNLFYDWLKKENKLGGQHKILRLSNQRDFIEELMAMNE